ncbi:glutamate/gamma-aminobutyrate family transporter YjeM [Loigolactobacillus iwatensis]|uniref:glutamate/gamma-aminobutyrate family transporter YjeM n=1 Tax=Loigolactobacillus iwatensis TaxID=1267156 RepID=UPI000F7DAA96|nr:glutamate/gamma-aminobutyrate family transporter YjeM [Loigolactobacillus iwatensis]
MATQKKITLVGLVLMIFGSIFGFANTTVAYYLMGYGGIIWYIIAAICFFLPSSLMFAEYGSTFKESHGGIYSWLAESIGPRPAFIGTFIWLASWIIWMVSTASKVWIPFSTFIFGSDKTQSWHLFGLTSNATIGLLGIIFFILITALATNGIERISQFASFGGTLIAILNVGFILVSLFILIKNGFHLAEPIHGIHTFVSSPNAAYKSLIGMLSFVVFAVFAYGGMETMGGVTDSMDKPAKNFPKGLIFATVLITISYALSIFIWGISANWNSILNNKTTNLGNITYVLMQNLGYFLGESLNLSHTSALVIGTWFARITGFTMFFSYLGAFFVLIYSPLKSFVLGTPKGLWPKGFAETNKAGMPARAMWCQAAFVSVLIFLVSFGGKDAQVFYNVLTQMANVSTTLPYLFLVTAFPFFKKRTDLERPFVIYKSKGWTNFITVVVDLVLVFGIIFTIVEPILEGQYLDAFEIIIGPIVFGLIAWLLYSRYEHRQTAKD